MRSLVLWWIRITQEGKDQTKARPISRSEERESQSYREYSVKDTFDPRESGKIQNANPLWRVYCRRRRYWWYRWAKCPVLYFDSAEMIVDEACRFKWVFYRCTRLLHTSGLEVCIFRRYANSRQKSDRATFVRKYCTRAGRAGFFYRISIEFCRVLLVEILLEPTWAHT